MIFTNVYGTVELFTDDELKELKINNNKISISLSAGADSALLLYLILITKPELEIFPYSILDLPGVGVYAQAIVDEYRNMFPESTIHNVVTFQHPDTIGSIDPIPAELKSSSYFKELISEYLDSNDINVTAVALTQAPEFMGIEDRPSTDSNIKTTVYTHRWEGYKRPTRYLPFINIDKRFIAELYKEYNLMDTIYPLTRSCVSGPDKTNVYTKPCKKCPWCKEKYWAFGQYDSTD